LFGEAETCKAERAWLYDVHTVMNAHQRPNICIQLAAT
jgi:hypothetical protein